MYKDKNFYLNLFQVSEAQLERLAADGLKGGGSYCDLFFENTSYNDLLLRDGIVSSGGFHIDYGVGIRVPKETRPAMPTPKARIPARWPRRPGRPPR